MKLKGKVAIVTGGARDIGREVSLRLAQEGAKVVVNYYGSEAEATETAKQITDAGGEAITVKADMTKWAEVVNLVDQTKKPSAKKYCFSQRDRWIVRPQTH